VTEHRDEPGLAEALKELAATGQRRAAPWPAPVIRARGDRLRRRRFTVAATAAVVLCVGTGGAVTAGLLADGPRTVQPARTGEPRPAPSSGPPSTPPVTPSTSSSPSSARTSLPPSTHTGMPTHPGTSSGAPTTAATTTPPGTTVRTDPPTR
jgi:hypothetical protein